MIINGGSFVNFSNNLVVGAQTNQLELNFCYKPDNPRVTSWPGNTITTNIFTWNSTRSDTTAFGIPGPPNGPPCIWVPSRVSHSDKNLFWNPMLGNASSARLFPGGLTFKQWQHGNSSSSSSHQAQAQAQAQAQSHPPFAFPAYDTSSLIGVNPQSVGDPYDGKLAQGSPAVTQLGFVPLPDIEGAAPEWYRSS